MTPPLVPTPIAKNIYYYYLTMRLAFATLVFISRGLVGFRAVLILVKEHAMQLRHPAICAAAVVCLGLGHAALAAQTGPYLSASGGWTTSSADAELTDRTAGEFKVVDSSLSLDDGYSAHAAAGYDFGPVRAELELGYFSNDIESVTSGGFDLSSSAWSGAEFDAFSIMVNAIADLPLTDSFSLFGGGGLGWTTVDIDSSAQMAHIEIDSEALAYQLIAGVGYKVTEHVELTALYRLWSALEAGYDDKSGSVDGQGDLEFPLIHSVELGLRYTF